MYEKLMSIAFYDKLSALAHRLEILMTMKISQWARENFCTYRKIYFRGVKFYYDEETHDVSSLLALVKINVAS